MGRQLWHCFCLSTCHTSFFPFLSTFLKQSLLPLHALFVSRGLTPRNVKTRLSVIFCAVLFPWPCYSVSMMPAWPFCFKFWWPNYAGVCRPLVMVTHTLPRFPHIPLTNLIHFHHDVISNPAMNLNFFFTIIRHTLIYKMGSPLCSLYTPKDLTKNQSELGLT